MATIFSSGYTNGCYFQIAQNTDGLINAKIETPLVVKETVVVDLQAARRWVDRQITKTLVRTHRED